jgi:hypothetical protein
MGTWLPVCSVRPKQANATEPIRKTEDRSNSTWTQMFCDARSDENHLLQRGAGLPISADPPGIIGVYIGADLWSESGLSSQSHRACHRGYIAVPSGLYIGIYIEPMSVGKCKQPHHKITCKTTAENY